MPHSFYGKEIIGLIWTESEEKMWYPSLASRWAIYCAYAKSDDSIDGIANWKLARIQISGGESN